MRNTGRKDENIACAAAEFKTLLERFKLVRWGFEDS